MNKEKLNKIFKYVLYSLSIVGLVGFIIYFIKGIYCSCVGDDILTSQNRIESSYQFLRMIIFGLIMVGSIIGAHYIKQETIFDKLLIKKNEK